MTCDTENACLHFMAYRVNIQRLRFDAVFYGSNMLHHFTPKFTNWMLVLLLIASRLRISLLLMGLFSGNYDARFLWQD